MKFEWDDLKDIENRKKHGISFEEAQAVFTSEFRLEYDSEHSSTNEDRFWAIGPLPTFGFVIVVFTETDDNIYRIISARKLGLRQVRK